MLPHLRRRAHAAGPNPRRVPLKVMRIAMATSLVAIAALTATSVSSASPSHATAPAAKTATLKIGLVTDIGGLNDRSFNHLAYLGVTEAQKKLGVQIKVLQSKSGSDYIPNLSTLAAQHYDLVIAVGFLMGDAVKAVSKQFPSTKFAIIDVDNPSAGGGKNVEGLTFHEEESGYVAGYLAGLMQKVKGPRNNGKNVVSTVGGVKIPPVDHYIAGFIAGSKAADPTRQGAERLLELVHGRCQVQVARADAARAGLRRRLRGRRRLRSRRAQRGEQQGRVGRRRRRRPGLPRPVHADLGRQEGRLRRVLDDRRSSSRAPSRVARRRRSASRTSPPASAATPRACRPRSRPRSTRSSRRSRPAASRSRTPSSSTGSDRHGR